MRALVYMLPGFRTPRQPEKNTHRMCSLALLSVQLLAVRSGEAHVTAALGSAVAHVSHASRQRLWQLWQSAAQAVTGTRLQPAASPATTPAASGAAQLPAPKAAGEATAVGGATVPAATGAPLASGLLEQSRAALQVSAAKLKLSFVRAGGPLIART